MTPSPAPQPLPVPTPTPFPPMYQPPEGPLWAKDEGKQADSALLTWWWDHILEVAYDTPLDGEDIP